MHSGGAEIGLVVEVVVTTDPLSVAAKAFDAVHADLGLEAATGECALDHVLTVPVLREIDDDACAVEWCYGVALDRDRHDCVDQSHGLLFVVR